MMSVDAGARARDARPVDGGSAGDAEWGAGMRVGGITVRSTDTNISSTANVSDCTIKFERCQDACKCGGMQIERGVEIVWVRGDRSQCIKDARGDGIMGDRRDEGQGSDARVGEHGEAVVRVGDRYGAILEECMAAGVMRGGNGTGNGEDLATKIECELCRDECTRFCGCLDDDRAGRESGNNTIPRGKMERNARGARDILTHECTTGTDNRIREAAVYRGRDARRIDPRAEDGNRPTMLFETRAMRNGINAVRQSRYDRAAGACERCDEMCCCRNAVR